MVALEPSRATRRWKSLPALFTILVLLHNLVSFEPMKSISAKGWPVERSVSLPSRNFVATDTSKGESRDGFKQETSNLLMSVTGRIKKKDLCTRSQVRKGKWLPIQREVPPYISHTKHLRCLQSETYTEGKWDSWSWTPFEDCLFTKWNATELCELLEFATVSIIGDSLSWEMYSSLLQLLGSRVHQTSQFTSKVNNTNHVQLSCRGHTQFIWRNDARLHNVAHSIHEDFPTVLILNRGAHFAETTELLDDLQSTLTSVKAWQEACTIRGVKCHFFWRTTVPGHPGCSGFSGPQNNISQMESLIENLNNYNSTTKKYRWYEFRAQNNAVLDMLSSLGMAYEIIDAYDINILRPDLHRKHQGDCLHNCYPGKMDVYSQLLLHYLKRDRSPEDSAFMKRRFYSYLSSVKGHQTSMVP